MTTQLAAPQTLTALVARTIDAAESPKLISMGNTPTTSQLKNGSYGTDDHK